MSVTLIPDAEAIVGKYLREHSDVIAIGARVAGRTPSTQKAPWVRVSQLDAPTRSGTVDHLIEFYLQLDCYAGETSTQAHTAQAEASLLARTVRGLLKVMHDEPHDGAVVTGVDVRSMARIPDTDGFDPARERYILTAFVWAHG